MGCSRQNVQKLLKEHDSFSPTPIYQGAKSIWHLATVLTWLLENKDYSVDPCLVETATSEAVAKSTATMTLNLAQQQQVIQKELILKK